MNLRFLILLLIAGLFNMASAGIRYVWQDSPHPSPPHTTWTTAAHAIQDAVDAAQDGDTVLVIGGIYSTGGRAVAGVMTNRVAIDKAIRVESMMGPEVTVIMGAAAPGGTNGDGAVRCAYVGVNAVLSGFTLTNGHTVYKIYGSDAEVRGGGAWCEASGVISNCVISGNVSYNDGGGVYGGRLFDCRLIGNQTVADSKGDGGAVDHSTLYDCTLTGNSGRKGGAADDSTLYSCVLVGNKAWVYGGAAARCVLYNCTLLDNSAHHGGGVSDCTLFNCIVYGNQGPMNSNYDVRPSYVSSFNYCCTTPLPPNGVGNIALDPQMASWSHLFANSPCIGAGSALYATGVDIDGEPWGTPPCIGADQLTPGAATSPLSVTLDTDFTIVTVGFSARFRVQVAGQTTGNRWDFGDGTLLTNRLEATHRWETPGSYLVQLTVFNDAHLAGVTATVTVHVVEVPVSYVNLNNAIPVFPHTNWATAATNIQDAIGAGSVAGRLVLVTNGVYDTGGVAVYGQMTNRIALINGVVVRSVNGAAVTFLRGAPAPSGTNGDGAIRCAYVGEGSVLDGFTLTNGYTRNAGHTSREQGGGGAWCESTAVVTNCIFIGNEAFRDGGGANGGVFFACVFRNNRAGDDSGAVDDAVLHECQLEGNSANESGGGASESVLFHCTLTGNSANSGGGTHYSTLNNCTLTGNSAGEDGGGAARSTLNNCELRGNSAKYNGGGASGSTLKNCILTDNLQYHVGGGDDDNYGGGGAYDCTMNNCMLAGNSAAGRFGGGGSAYSTLNNCTLTGNSANSGGGMYRGTLNNCTLTCNSALYSGGGAAASTLNNCTITGNSAEYGGGTSSGNDEDFTCELNNCIVYYNSARWFGANWSDSDNSIFNYCCTTPLPSMPWGTGNLTNAPLFVNTNGWSNLRLQTNSPCINAGNNAYVNGNIDLDGRPRITGGTVDIGAYEHQGPSMGEFIGWLEHYGLHTDGSVDADDPDCDGIANWGEWRTSTDPTNVQSVLRIFPPAHTGSNVALSWQNVVGVSYFLEQSTNVAGSPAFTPLGTNLSGVSGTISFTHTNAANRRSGYYRIGVSGP